MQQPWRTAATLILTAPSIATRSIKPKKKILHGCFITNYTVLMLQRSSKNNFFPDAYVFPGGGLDKADETCKWLEIFDGVDSRFVKKLDQLQLNPKRRTQSPMLLDDASLTDDDLPREISYRICAIRETFEETGLLLARSGWKKTKDESRSNEIDNFVSIFKFEDSNTANYWREKVNSDANNFLTLCQYFRCVPDIWCLHEWSDWLTPVCSVNVPPKRYDTVFYKAAIRHLPEYLKEDNREISSLDAKQPGDFLEDYYNGKCVLGNPQVYELLRLINYNEHEDLINFFVKRGVEGLERYLPLIAFTKDNNWVALYPGDQDYPFGMVQTSEDDPIKLPVTTKEMYDQYKTRTYNRVVMGKKGSGINVMCNCDEMPFCHVKPIDTQKLFLEVDDARL